MALIIPDPDISKKIFTEFLVGSTIIGFSSISHFSFSLVGSTKAKYFDKLLPFHFELHIYSDWWIGTNESRKKRISELTEVYGGDKNDIIKAMTAKIISSPPNNLITSVSILDTIIEIMFVTGLQVSLPIMTGERLDVRLTEDGSEGDNIWSVSSCVGGFVSTIPDGVLKKIGS